MSERKDFDIDIDFDTEYSGLLQPGNKKKKSVSINRENDFEQTLFNQKIKPLPNTNKKRGRPVEITDDRYKVTKPKKISPALESKLNVMQDYVEELQSVKGRITFEKLVDTLAEAYITQKLGVSKEEHLRAEIKEAFEKL
ncbi:hypothetical protein ACT46A_002700 [Enterococcus hirae]|uniref:hypothetical protein n=1 Tax=Enterococcus hirae TaxID=1354 RepID=UPI0009BCEF75|nr:hypothetical protein [Enterococcus hirae]EMF0131560.1 hypothetical protein [Enterococcus hirae]EMF0512138.1 hypothetical protein [Enterococcus hirae]EMF0520365.1 hypothetical protein [Enterococcus hirae]OQO43547.1 hypothetical protein BH737_12145 [Enterococcus hirae]OQO55519.1 hypothetical protein BHG15_13365 [Enterococcus hirae]